MEATDNELIRVYQQGGTWAFDVLHDRYKGWVMSLFFGPCYFYREELTQEVFFKAWRSLHRFNINQASFKTWLTAIGKHTKIDFLRKQKRGKGIISIDSLEGEAFDELLKVSASEEPPASALRSEAASKLEEALQHLPSIHQQVFNLRGYEEMNFREIGEILGLSRDRIRQIWYEALCCLKRLLSSYKEFSK